MSKAMGTQETIEQILFKYAVDKHFDDKGDSRFLSVTDQNNKELQLVVHFVKDRIYSVNFINNAFFELPDDQLEAIVKSILDGDYEVHKSFFRQKPSIALRLNNKKIMPEHIHNLKDGATIYAELPKVFTKK